jgi:hypothetical protein
MAADGFAAQAVAAQDVASKRLASLPVDDIRSEAARGST